MRKPIFGGNWKMNTTRETAKELAEGLAKNLGDITDKEVVLFPPFVYIPMVIDIVKNTNIKVGAQNSFYEEKGAYTGEISPYMIKDIGCSYVIIGHSERRHIIGESNEILNKKIKKALEAELNIIYCVGELLEERETGKTNEVVLTQIREGLDGVSKDDMKKIVIAYEPVWAIGTGKNAEPEDAERVCKLIRDEISKLYSKEIGESTRIQYGGSVKPANIKGFMEMEDIDGALVGGASLKVKDFTEIVLYDTLSK